jgi:hypothetical protein
MIFIPDRLVTAGQVDDAKPAYAKENFASHPGAAFIRTSMKKRVSRIPSMFDIYLSAPDLAVNPAHMLIVPRILGVPGRRFLRARLPFASSRTGRIRGVGRSTPRLCIRLL